VVQAITVAVEKAPEGRLPITRRYAPMFRRMRANNHHNAHRTSHKYLRVVSANVVHTGIMPPRKRYLETRLLKING